MKPTAPWQTPEVQKAIRRFMLLALLLLLPVFAVALFDRPSADDYLYAIPTRAVVVNGGGFGELLRTAWAENLRYYRVWNGTYLSSFLATLQPGIFGGRWYALTLLVVIVPLFLCLWGALRLVLDRLLPGSRLPAAAAALLVLVMLVEGMPNQVEGLFWYDGVVFYQPFFALTVLNAGLAFALAWGGARGRGAAYLAANCLCSILIPGGHPTLGLLNVMFQTIAAALAILCRPAPGKRRNLCLLPGALLSAAGLAFNVTAPGVGARAAGFQSASIPEAVVKSFVLAALELVRWLDVPLLCFLFLLTPLGLWAARQNRAGLPLFRYFWLPPAVTFVLMWGMTCLPSYTMGGIGPGRLTNIVWMTFVLGTAVSYIALLGWLVHRKSADLSALQGWLARQGKYLTAAAVAAVLCIACIGGRTVKEGLDNRYATTLEALWELGQGVPQRFAAAMDAREAALTDPGTDAVTLRRLNEEEKPFLLYFTDLSPDLLWDVDKFYGKTVTVE